MSGSVNGSRIDISGLGNVEENHVQGFEDISLSDNESFSDSLTNENMETMGGDCDFDPKFAINGIEVFNAVNFGVMCLDEFMKFHFASPTMAYRFYNRYARKNGFAARKSRVVRNSNEEIIQQSFVCNREGKMEKKSIQGVGAKRQQRPSIRCGCEARMVVHIDGSNSRWYIKDFDDKHNHPFVDDDYKRMLAPHRTISRYDENQMMKMREVGIKTSNIYALNASQAKAFENLGYSKRDIYNLHAKHRRNIFTDAKVGLDFLESSRSGNDKLFWRHTVDVEGRLQNLFWCDAISRADYSVFGGVLAFDATYKKVRYLCPLVVFSGVNHHNQSTIFGAALVGKEDEETYVWVLRQFLEAMGGKCPVSVITDGDLAMRNAIKLVFPSAHHRLCAWHLIRIATAKVKNPKLLSLFKQCLLGDFHENTFNRKWVQMVEEANLHRNSWMLQMYEKRTMWAACLIRGNFFAGFRTTSRCESLNVEFRSYVSVRDSLIDFLYQFNRWLGHTRHRELEADFASSYGEPSLETPYKSLERSGANLYTREILKLYRAVLQKACNCMVIRIIETNGNFCYTVRRFDTEWRVSFFEATLEFKCSCMRFESWGIPCEHIISVLLLLKIVKLPDCLVLKRWTNHAKDTLILPKSSRVHARDPDLINTFFGVMEHCKVMVTAALESGRPDYFRMTIELIAQHTRMLNVGSTDEVNPPDDPIVNPGIRNPVIVRTKGCGGQSSKKSRKRAKCGICGYHGHNRKSCQARNNVVSDSNRDQPLDCYDDQSEDEDYDYANVEV